MVEATRMYVIVELNDDPSRVSVGLSLEEALALAQPGHEDVPRYCTKVAGSEDGALERFRRERMGMTRVWPDPSLRLELRQARKEEPAGEGSPTPADADADEEDVGEEQEGEAWDLDEQDPEEPEPEVESEVPSGPPDSAVPLLEVDDGSGPLTSEPMTYYFEVDADGACLWGSRAAEQWHRATDVIDEPPAEGWEVMASTPRAGRTPRQLARDLVIGLLSEWSSLPSFCSSDSSELLPQEDLDAIVAGLRAYCPECGDDGPHGLDDDGTARCICGKRFRPGEEDE